MTLEQSEMGDNERDHVPVMPEIAHPRFARAYNWLMGQPMVRRGFDPVRREIVGQARGLVLEVGAGGGQNFPLYDPTRVMRVEAVEPDETMLVTARRRLAAAPVPITLVRAAVEALPFPDAAFGQPCRSPSGVPLPDRRTVRRWQGRQTCWRFFWWCRPPGVRGR